MALLPRRAPAAKPARTAAFTASAARIKLDDPAHADTLKRKQKWQDEAWSYRDTLGEIRFAAEYQANAVARVRLFAAVDVGDGQEPMPADEAVDTAAGDTPLISPELAAAAQQELARIRSQIGGQPALQAAYAENMFIAGECYLVAVPEQITADGIEPEQWDIRSTAELGVNPGTGRYEVRTSPDAKPRELPADALVVRFWRRHPRWGDLADSSLRGVLDACEELLILSRAIRGQARSRIAGAGVLFVAQELSFGPDDAALDGDRTTEDDPFAEDLTEAMVTPLADESSAAAVVPLVARVPAKYVKRGMGWDFWQPERPIDDRAVTLRQELRTVIATGISMPAEVLTGKAGLNHWSAWQIDEETYKAHVDPAVIAFCDGLTTSVLRPALLDLGFSAEQVERVVVWRDPTALVVRPNRFADAAQAHDRMAVSDAALRDAGGFTDADAPDEEELARRVGVRRGILDAAITRALLEQFVLPEGADLPEPAVPGEPPAEEEAPAAPGTPNSPPGQDAVTAAASPRVRALGRRLTAIDRSLRDRLHAAADAAVRSAVEVAGKRVKARVASAGSNGRRWGAAYDAVRDVPARRIPATLGPALVAAAGMTDDELLADALSDMERQFDVWVADAQEATADEVTAAAGLPGEARDDLLARFADARAAAWTGLAAALLDIARSRLYDPDPQAPDVGEHTPGTVVPAGVVRTAVARAGGAGMAVDSGGVDRLGRPLLDGEPPALGLATGPYVLGALAAGGIEPEGYTWSYGVSRRPFEPHRALDGAEFASFTDPVLANSYGWPDVAFFAPGDHDGCGCDVTPSFMLRESPAPPVAGLSLAAAAR